MSGKIRVHLSDGTQYDIPESEADAAMRQLETDGEDFTWEDAPKAPVAKKAPQAEMVVGEPEVLNTKAPVAPQTTQPIAPPRLQPVLAPPPKAKSWTDSLGETVGDFAVPAANSALLGWGDELAGLVGGDDWKKAARDRLQLAHDRSPWAAGAGDVAGAVGTSVLTGGLGGAGLAANAARLGIMGAAAGAGNAPTTDSMLLDAGLGAAIGMGSAGAGAGLSKLGSMGADKFGQMIGKAAGAIPNTAIRAAGAGVGGTLGALADGTLGTSAGYAGAGLGSSAVAPLARSVSQATSKAVGGAAEWSAPMLQPLLRGTGSALSTAGGPAINSLLGAPSLPPPKNSNAITDVATQSLANLLPNERAERNAALGVGNSKPTAAQAAPGLGSPKMSDIEAVKVALQAKPELLGTYQSDLASLAEKHDDAKLNAKITELIMNNEDFRARLRELPGK